MSVFNSKCCHMHGCEAWRFDSKHVGRYWTAWNRCMRILMKLHPATHTVLLPLIGKTVSAKDQAAKRVIGLIKSMANNPNRRTLYITLNSIKDHDSIFGRNVDSITSWYRISRSDVFQGKNSCRQSVKRRRQLLMVLMSCVWQKKTFCKLTVLITKTLIYL